jgi:NhaP-type Na+/H+ or K+/H+ antiporter
VEVRRRIDEPQMEISISLLTAYLAYLPADRLGASGVLAAVAAGLYTGGRTELMLSPTSRLRTLGFWDALSFLLESVLFLLIGLQLPHITQGLSVGTPLLYSAAVVATLVAVRMAWMFSVPQLIRLAVPRWGETEPGPAERTVLGWSGMRGGVSLAAALAVPLIAEGHAFPDRAVVIFIAYITIAVTLVIPGLTLSPLLRRLGLGEEEAVAREEARARVLLAHAALRRIEDLAEREQLPEALANQLRVRYEQRIHRFGPGAEGRERDGDDAAETAQRMRELQHELIGAERRRLADLRRRGEISTHTQRRIEHELDLEESRLAQ